MPLILDFFKKDIEQLARLSLPQKLYLQQIFSSNCIFRYHQEFSERWRLIFERSLVDDLCSLYDPSSSSEEEILHVFIQQAQEHNFEDTAESLEMFLKNCMHGVVVRKEFYESFYATLFSQIQQKQQSHIPLYALTQAYLSYFVQQFSHIDAQAQHQWKALSSFFSTPDGDLTPFFRMLAAKIIYKSSRSRKSSSPSIKLSSKRSFSANRFENNIYGLYDRVQDDINFLMKNLKQLQKGRYKFNSADFQFYKKYGIEIHASYSRLIGLPSITVVLQYRRCRNLDLAQPHSQLEKQLLQNILIEAYAHYAVSHAQNPHMHNFFRGDVMARPRYNIWGVSEIDDMDFIQSVDSDDASLSSRGRSRSQSYQDDVWTEFGAQWVELDSQQQCDSLLAEIARLYEWPKEFLTVALSSLCRDDYFISTMDLYAQSAEEFDFQKNFFEALCVQWSERNLTLMREYSDTDIYLPFAHKNIRNNPKLLGLRNSLCIDYSFFSSYSSRFSRLDTTSLETLVSNSYWEPHYDIELLYAGLHRESVYILEKVLSKERYHPVSLGHLFSRLLHLKNWPLILSFVLPHKDSHIYGEEETGNKLHPLDWLILVDDALCFEKQVKNYRNGPDKEDERAHRLIKKYFAQLVSRCSDGCWKELLSAQEPEQLLSYMLYCPDWAYPINNHGPSFFEKLPLEKKIVFYELCLKSFTSDSTPWVTLLQFICSRENNPEVCLWSSILLGEQSQDLSEIITSLWQGLVASKSTIDSHQTHFYCLMLSFIMRQDLSQLGVVVENMLDSDKDVSWLEYVFSALNKYSGIESGILLSRSQKAVLDIEANNPTTFSHIDAYKEFLHISTLESDSVPSVLFSRPLTPSTSAPRFYYHV